MAHVEAPSAAELVLRPLRLPRSHTGVIVAYVCRRMCTLGRVEFSGVVWVLDDGALCAGRSLQKRSGFGGSIMLGHLVRACNELRIVIDVSHLNERGFWDVLALTEAPLVAGHSNALCPSTRNLTDPRLDAMAASEGMFGVNFLREDAARDANTPVDVMVRPIDYLVEWVGIDRVGFDFDGGFDLAGDSRRDWPAQADPPDVYAVSRKGIPPRTATWRSSRRPRLTRGCAGYSQGSGRTSWSADTSTRSTTAAWTAGAS